MLLGRIVSRDNGRIAPGRSLSRERNPNVSVRSIGEMSELGGR
jgi:hypothetical protein